MKESKWLILYYITMLFLFIHSMYPWFTFEYENAYICLGALFVTVLVNNRAKIFCKTRQTTIVSVVFLCLYLWLSKYANMYGYIEVFLQWLILTFVIKLRNEYKVELVNFITKYFSLLLSISIVAYVLFLLGTPIPNTNVEFHQYYLDNYFFFLHKEMYRFQSVFLEPGHMTMGLAPLLFINRYNLRNKYVFVLFVAQMLSLSLAGYMSMIIGYSLLLLFDKQAKKSKAMSIILSLVLVSAVASFMQNNIDSNLFEDLIFRRMSFENGHFVGDNRSSVYLDAQFNALLDSNDIYTGHYFDSEMSEKGVAGYKKFIVQYGLIGAFLLTIAFFSNLTNLAKSPRRNAFLLIVMLILLMIQNAYPTWWCIVISMIVGTAYMQDDELKKFQKAEK